MRPRVLLISYDPVGAEMSGMGIRVSELARVLAEHAEVTVAHGGRSSDPLPGIETVAFSPHDPSALRGPVAAADAVVSHPVWPQLSGWLRRSRARVIHDLYVPETFETLELLAGRPPIARRVMGHATLDRLHDALRTGHHFVCASEKQRDLWLGSLLALRLIDPLAYDGDRTLRSIIDVVPFGLPGEPPAPNAAAGPGPRQRFRQVGDEAELVLWNGGIWNWLDAETAVRAVAALAARRQRLRLVFMGGSQQLAARAATERARAVAAELGVLDRTVLFHGGWVPYGERAAWLTQADCAISTHREHLETRFAFRTRLLDCFWAGLPVVCTEGDDLADRIAREELGATVAPGDPSAVATALERVLDRGRAHYAQALARAAADHAWERVARPLVRWVCADEQPARPGDAAGAGAPSAAQRARSLAYRLGGRQALTRAARLRAGAGG
jgi:glycosyltransferase involved in cell wall biosynthesis